MYIGGMTTPTEETVQAWVDLARAYNCALTAVENALKSAEFPALRWYDVLLELDRAGADGLRPFELQKNLLLPQYGVSRLIARIEKAGYLERVSCEDDGRGQNVAITISGRELRKQMWPIYRKALQEVIGLSCTPREASELSVLLKKIIKP